MSRGTKCRKFLYSLSINPPSDKAVTTADFEDAISKAEERLGLSGQPRVVIFHEKAARRHCHVVWSRIDIDKMKAVELPYDRTKLMEVSRELHIHHGWQMPKGLTDQSLTDPKNYTLAQYQQAKRIGKNAKNTKTAFQDAWAISDNGAAFHHAMGERGYTLARDKSRILGVDRFGEVYAVARWVGVKTKDVRAKLGKDYPLPSIDEAKAQNATIMSKILNAHQIALGGQRARHRQELIKRRNVMIAQHRKMRAQVFEQIHERQNREWQQRQNRFRHGLVGLWDRMRGHNARIRKENEIHALQCLQRDRAEKDNLILQQLSERRAFDTIAKRELAHIDHQRRDIIRDRLDYRHAFSNRASPSPEPEI